MQSVKKVVTQAGVKEADSGIIAAISGNESLCPSLSWETRVKGFICCFIIGVALSVLGSVLVFFQNYVGFAFLYSAGTFTAIGSTMFLRGPSAQLKAMFREKRLIATIVMLAMVGLTICAAVWWKNPVLCLVFCLLQFVAFTWYSLSYIPFARDAVKNGCESCLA